MGLDDVDVDAADQKRVDRLVDSTSFTEDEAEAVVRFAKVDEDDRAPSQIRRYVSNVTANVVEDGLTPNECADIRRAMDRATRPTTVIDRFPDKHPSVIFRHATGDCSHDAAVDPTTSPRITRDECRDFRTDFQTGDTVTDLQANYNRSANAVVRHVFGRCDHVFDRDRSGKRLSESLCVRMRRAYRENDSTSIADIGRAFLVGTSTAHRHLVGDCGHRDAVEAPIGAEGSARIDADECGLMRVAYAVDTDPSVIADTFDRDVTAVRRHVFGRCQHDGDGADPRVDFVPADLCKAIRHKYKTRGVDSVRSIIDRLGVTKGTFYYHLGGRCDHDHDVDPVDTGN